jgi:1-acyl-sn-glycerol-3-phosphate acyltransferase
MSDMQRNYSGAGAARGNPAPSRRAPALRWLDALRQHVVYYFLLLLLAAMCLSWQSCAAVLGALLSPDAGRRIGRAAIQRIWYAYFRALSAFGACRFDLSELEALRGQPAMILAPNHPSLIDALLIASRVPNLCCVMKADLANNLFLGAGARLADYIVNDAPRGMIKDAIDDLRRGNPLLVFPEGTRTEHLPVNPLKGGVALIAARARRPVQTLIIETDSPFLGKGWQILRKPELPVTYRVRLGRRFAPPGNASGAAQAFMAELQRYYTAELGRDSMRRAHSDPDPQMPADPGAMPPRAQRAVRPNAGRP